MRKTEKKKRLNKTEREGKFENLSKLKSEEKEDI